MPNIIIIHVGSNDVSPEAIDTDAYSAEVGDFLKEIYGKIEQNTTELGSNFDLRILFSDILHRPWYDKFQLLEQNTADLLTSITNSKILTEMEGCNWFDTIQHSEMPKSAWKLFAKFQQPKDNVHLSIAGNMVLLKSIEFVVDHILR